MVNKTSRTFNEVSWNYFSAPNQNRVRWNMVPSDPSCCVLIPPVSYILGFDEEILNSWKTWDFKNGGDNSKWEKNVEHARSPELRSKLILLNNLVSINSDTAEQMLSVIEILFWQLSEPAPQWRRASVLSPSVWGIAQTYVVGWVGFVVGFRFSAPTVKSGDSSPF